MLISKNLPSIGSSPELIHEGANLKEGVGTKVAKRKSRVGF